MCAHSNLLCAINICIGPQHTFFLTHKFTYIYSTQHVVIVRAAHNADYVAEIFFSLHLSFFGRLSFVSMFAVVCVCVCVLHVLQSNILEPVHSNVVWSREPLIFVCESFIICIRDTYSQTVHGFVSFSFFSFGFVLFCPIQNCNKIFCFVSRTLESNCFFFYFYLHVIICIVSYVFVCCPLTKRL